MRKVLLISQVLVDVRSVNLRDRAVGELAQVAAIAHEIDTWLRLDVDDLPAFFELQLPPIKVETIDAPAALSVRSGRIAELCDHQLPAAVYVCHDSDVSNAIEARDLQVALSQRLPLPAQGGRTPQRLILAVQNHATLGIANTPASGRLAYQIEEENLSTVLAKTMVTDRADRLAMGYHAVYADPSVQPWLDEPFFVKESNRDLADHLAIKARYAGIDAKTVAQIVFEGDLPTPGPALIQNTRESGLSNHAR